MKEIPLLLKRGRIEQSRKGGASFLIYFLEGM